MWERMQGPGSLWLGRGNQRGGDSIQFTVPGSGKPTFAALYAGLSAGFQGQTIEKILALTVMSFVWLYFSYNEERAIIVLCMCYYGNLGHRTELWGRQGRVPGGDES